MREVHEAIQRFLSGSAFGVAGASSNRSKYGNKVLRCYLQNGRTAYPLHPTETSVEGVDAYKDVASLPEPIHGLSIITPPPVTRRVVREALAAGVRHFWMQPGAEDEEAIEAIKEAGGECIAWGPCLLVVLGFREH